MDGFVWGGIYMRVCSQEEEEEVPTNQQVNFECLLACCFGVLS